MPVKKCGKGKYKIGTGKCMYDSKAKAERAYKGYLGHKFAESYQKIMEEMKPKAYEYLGDCISTVDDSCIWDATEMAQLIENSDRYDIQNMYPFLDGILKYKVKNNPESLECGINGDIVWIYDTINDIHHFYKEI